MFEEKETDRFCSTCLYYDVYYVRYGDSFARLNYGFCARTHEQLQSERETCEKMGAAGVGCGRFKIFLKKPHARA